MPRLRLLLAWLLLAALPLQGLAAASMLFCGSQAGQRMSQLDSAAHHGGHGVDHTGGHASHDHASHGPADEPSGHAPIGDDGATQGHACPVCASCSQAQAVGGFEPLAAASPAPVAGPLPPPVRITSRTPTLPDKPPRA